MRFFTWDFLLEMRWHFIHWIHLATLTDINNSPNLKLDRREVCAIFNLKWMKKVQTNTFSTHNTCSKCEVMWLQHLRHRWWEKAMLLQEEECRLGITNRRTYKVICNSLQNNVTIAYTHCTWKGSNGSTGSYSENVWTGATADHVIEFSVRHHMLPSESTNCCSKL